MLWKFLIPLCLLCISGLASGEEDFEYIGKRKLTSVRKDDESETEETLTENNEVEDTTEDQTQNEEGEEEDKIMLNGEEEEGKEVQEVKRQEDTPKLSTESMKRNTFHCAVASWQLENTYLHLYTRNQKIQVVPASSWFKDFVPNRDLVILMPGPWNDYEYQKNFFDTLSSALLNESNYNIIGVDWRYHVAPEENSSYYAANVYSSTLMGVMLHDLFKNHFPGFFDNKFNAYYIGHDLGAIPPITFQQKLKKPFHYVYGLNPRVDLPEPSLRLTQEHGEVVALLTTHDYPYSYGHKNIIPVIHKGSLPDPQHVLAKAIQEAGTGTFCCSKEHFDLGYCDKLARAPIWFTQPFTSERSSLHFGKYYYNYDSDNKKSKCLW